jgi:hypothetical protein
MPRENICGFQANAVCKRNTNLLQNLFEHPSHCENGGACIYLFSVWENLTHLAARCLGAVDHGDAEALRCKLQRSDKTAHAGANDDNPLRSHFAVLQ